MTHRYVLDMVRARLKSVDGERVRTIQFVNRNTIHGTQVSTDSHTYIPVHVYLYEHKTCQSHSTDSRASEMELGHILRPSDPVTRQSSDPETQLTRQTVEFGHTHIFTQIYAPVCLCAC